MLEGLTTSQEVDQVRQPNQDQLTSFPSCIAVPWFLTWVGACSEELMRQGMTTLVPQNSRDIQDELGSKPSTLLWAREFFSIGMCKPARYTHEES